MNQITFEQLPRVVQDIKDQINYLTHLVTKQSFTREEKKKMLKVPDACALLGISKPTLYRKVTSNQIKCFKDGKDLFFREEDLNNYINSIGKKEQNEIQLIIKK